MCASKGVASPASTVLLLLKGTATGSCCTVLTGYALYFLSSAQATVYKCEGDKSITALYAFQDEDVSSLYHPAVVRLSVLSHVNAVRCYADHCQCCHLSLLSHVVSSLINTVACHAVTCQCCHMSCCHLSLLLHVMLSLINAVTCHSAKCSAITFCTIYIVHAGSHSSNLHVVPFLLSCLGM